MKYLPAMAEGILIYALFVFLLIIPCRKTRTSKTFAKTYVGVINILYAL